MGYVCVEGAATGRAPATDWREMAVSRLSSTAKVDSTASGYGLGEGDFDVTYEGATFGTYEHNGYNDSDFFAVVWDAEAGATRAVEYATTRGWTYANGATVDATDEVKAAAGEYIAARDIESWNLATAHDALMVEKGSAVEVFKGRKVPIGTTGTVIWIGADRYKRGAFRVGVKDEAGEVHWTAEDNVRVTDGAARLTDLDEIARSTALRITRLIKDGQANDWVSAHRSRGGALGNRFSVGEKQIAALLAETGRDKIDGAALYRAAAAALAAEEQEQAETVAAYHAEADKPKSERDEGTLVALARKIGGSA